MTTRDTRKRTHTPHGYKIIDRRPFRFNSKHHEVIMVDRGPDHHDRFVVWCMERDTGVCTSGGYYRFRKDADRDFAAR